MVSNTLSARAEMPSTAPTAERLDESPTVVVPTVEPDVISISTADPLATKPTVTKVAEGTAGQVEVQQTTDLNETQADSQLQSAEAAPNDLQTSAKAIEGEISAEPMPGTVETSATFLTNQPAASSVPEVSSEEANTTVAQTDIDPGRTTRGGASYIGIGGNLGLGGDTTLGDGAFVINSKIGLTRSLSVRPAALVGNDAAFLIPLTYDFVIRREDPFEEVPFAPFLGGGVVFSTGEDDNIGFLLTGGVDVPLTSQFVANASLNVGFIEDSTDVGLIVGVGYTFVGF